jgi:hypothetical protein
MTILVTSMGPYLSWCGLEVNMPNWLIFAHYLVTGLMVATGSVTLNGIAFTVLLS